MNTNCTQLIRLLFACIISLALLAGALTLAGQARSSVYAAPLNLAPAWTPVVTITQPMHNDILTRTPQLVEIAYNCGMFCLGTAKMSAVSVTVSGDAGPYYTASLAISGTLGGVYTYTWSLEEQDYVAHKLNARARNAWGSVGASAPITVYVDTIPPRDIVITAPTYTENSSFPVSWRASDGSGVTLYDLQYQRDDQESWTTWLTNSSVTSQTFTTTESGHSYTWRARARDKGHNLSGWITTMTQVGPYHIYLPLVARNYPPLWQQGAGSQGSRFRTPSGCGDTTWYAGTFDSNGVWKSTDSAHTWTKIADWQAVARPVVANPANCNDAFVAVWGQGIYRLTGTSVPIPINNGLGELYLYGLALDGDTLYAGANSRGVYKKGIDDVNWQAVNNGISDLRIRSLYVLGSGLYAGGRGCNIYVSPDGGSSWVGLTVLTAGCDDAQVWSIAEVENTLYAGLGLEKGLYYLDGVVWKPVAGIPAGNVYGLAFDAANDYLYASVYGSGVYRCQVDGVGEPMACSTHNLGLLTLDTREIRIHNELLVVGSDDGAWRRPLLP